MEIVAYLCLIVWIGLTTKHVLRLMDRVAKLEAENKALEASVQVLNDEALRRQPYGPVTFGSQDQYRPDVIRFDVPRMDDSTAGKPR